MKLLYRVGADVLFVMHLALVLLAVFGWAVPSLWWVYMGALVVTLISDVVLGYCILSKWEFDLRKRLDPTVDYNYTWTTFYTYRITKHRISDTFFRRSAIIALTLAISTNL